MKILLHICCAPCLITPYESLSESGYDVTGFFHNNNIHPYTEFKRRLDTLKDYTEKIGMPVIYDELYDLKAFFRKVAFNEEKRCYFCYLMRLQATADFAAQGGYDAFSTTLLYSKYQNHDMIKRIGDELAKEYGIDFYYEDFRKGWGRGIKLSKKLNMYRQQYCGCVYSERDRYMPAEIRKDA